MSESDRKRERYGHTPTLAGEVNALHGTGIAAPLGETRFPFISWAASARFRYPLEAQAFLCQCESAAEAFFARAFVARGGIVWRDNAPIYADGTQLRLQVKRGALRIDAVAERNGVKLAIEVDGMTFHARKYDQVAADYLRERRLIALGYVLVRFTAQEVFADSDACWEQISTILTAHNRAGSQPSPTPSPTRRSA